MGISAGTSIAFSGSQTTAMTVACGSSPGRRGRRTRRLVSETGYNLGWTTGPASTLRPEGNVDHRAWFAPGSLEVVLVGIGLAPDDDTRFATGCAGAAEVSRVVGIFQHQSNSIEIVLAGLDGEVEVTAASQNRLSLGWRPPSSPSTVIAFRGYFLGGSAFTAGFSAAGRVTRRRTGRSVHRWREWLHHEGLPDRLPAVHRGPGSPEGFSSALPIARRHETSAGATA